MFELKLPNLFDFVVSDFEVFEADFTF